MLRGATAALFILVVAGSVSQIVQESQTAERDGDVVLTISDTQKRQYLRQNVTSDAYRYGYDVDSNGQFHHETRGPDGITYGCYGHVDPFHRLITTFYLSDGWGYRVVSPGKDVELFLHEHEHQVGGSVHDHHGVVTPWTELHFPAVCAEYTRVSKIPSSGTPVGKGSAIDASSTRPAYEPALDGKPGLHGALETPHAGYPGRTSIPRLTDTSRNLPGISRLLTRPEQPRTFVVSDTPDTPGTPVYTEQTGGQGTLIPLQRPETPGISDVPETLGTPETSGSLTYHGQSISSEISGNKNKISTQDVLESSSYSGQHGTSGTLGISGVSRRPIVPAQPGQPGIPETFGVPVISATPKLLSHSQYSGISGTPETSGTPEIVGAPGSLAYPKQPSSLGKSDTSGTAEVASHSKQLGAPGAQETSDSQVSDKSGTRGTFDIPGILFIPGLSGTSKVSSLSGTARISGGLAYPKQPNSPDISDTLATPGSSSRYPGQSGASRTPGRLVVPAYSRQSGTAKALNISSTSAAHRLPPYLEYIDTPDAPESSNIPETSSTSRQSDVPRTSGASSTLGLLLRQKQLGATSASKSFGVPKTSDVLNYSAQTFITRPGIPGTVELSPHSNQLGILNTPGTSGSSVYSKQPGAPRILDTSGTSALSSRQEQLDIIGTPGRPGSLVYSKQPGVSRISDSLNTSGISFYSEQSDIIGASRRPGSLVYSKQPGVSRISDSLDTPGVSFHSEQSGTIGASRRPESPVYSKQPGGPGISDTSGIFESSSYSEQLGTPGIPNSRRISGKAFSPAYSEQQDISKSSLSGGGTSGSIFYREHTDAPGSRKSETFAYSKILSDKSLISSKHGSSKRPKVEFESSDEVIGGVGGTDGVNREGDVGSDGPNGPWPTGSPGPNGPWPGDPDYLPGIEPTRRPSQAGSIRHQHSKTRPLGTNNYKSVTRYYFENKTEPYADYESTKLEISANASVPLYTKQLKPQYKLDSTSSIYEKKDTYNTGEINSLSQTGSTSSLSKDNVKSHEDADFVKSSPRIYDHASHVETHRTETPLKQQDSEQLSVHDRSQYRKSVFYSKSQSSNGRYNNKSGRQESSFNIRGRYNDSDADSESISNASFQPDGSTTGAGKQVNSGLEQSFQANPGLDAIGIHPPGLINVKPFPLPIGPDPQACPCYLVGPGNSTNVATGPTTTSVIGQVGFIPVIFVPHCPGDETDRKTKAIFPSATPVPYACDACGARDTALGIRPLDINRLGDINYLREVLNQANLGFLNVPVKTGANRRSGAENGVRNARDLSVL